MASDVFNFGYSKPAGFHVAVNVETPVEAERLFKALSEGGQVTMKMEETFFAHRFGQLVDRFGTPWMIVNAKPEGREDLHVRHAGGKEEPGTNALIDQLAAVLATKR